MSQWQISDYVENKVINTHEKPGNKSEYKNLIVVNTHIKCMLNI